MAHGLIFKDSPRPGVVYGYRTRKPHLALLHRRHWGYVGQTRNEASRHREHMIGVGRYGHRDPAPWSDLDARRYILWRSASVRNWRLNFMEWLMIKLLLPVYNVRMNATNPRRIPKYRAVEARRLRDQGAPYRWAPRPGHLIVPVLALVVLWLLL